MTERLLDYNCKLIDRMDDPLGPIRRLANKGKNGSALRGKLIGFSTQPIYAA